MRILTIASQKGGAGKTTLATHLAVVDTDPQGSLAAWWNSREAPTPLFASVEIARLPDHLRTLERYRRLDAYAAGFVPRKTHQEILVEALDAYLAQVAE